MAASAFKQVAQAIEKGNPSKSFDILVKKFKKEKNYPGVFEARLMKKRLDLGLPAIQTDALGDLPSEARGAYEAEQISAAREVGELFLADGDIYRAWPYFRAIGDRTAVRTALDGYQSPSGDEDGVDGIVEIAFHEQVNPRRGFELILQHYGTCRAITNFSHYPSDDGREECGRLLVDQLTTELRDSLKRAIEQHEGSEPETDSISELVAGRDWLFEGNNYYIDTSHVSSVVQLSINWNNPETLRLVLELTDYGRRLGEMYQFKGEPPLEDVYEDSAIYLRALLGEEVDEAVTHFSGKLSSEPDPYGNPAAQAVVRFLVRLERYDDAIEVALQHLKDVPPSQLQCPSVIQLCQLAGDFSRLTELAREQGDLLGYTAGAIQKAS